MTSLVLPNMLSMHSSQLAQPTCKFDMLSMLSMLNN